MGWKPDAMTRKQWIASAVTAAILAAAGGTTAVLAQSEGPPVIEWDKRRLERLERNVRRLENQLARANRDPNAPPTIIEPDPEVIALQTRVDEMSMRLQDLEMTLQRLTGQLESATFDLQQARRDQTDARNELGPMRTRIAELETRLAAIEEAGAPAAGGDPQAEYDAALKLMNDGAYTEATGAWEAFVARYPDAAQTPEAYYRLGESLYVRDEPAMAASAYARSLRGWPKTTWAAEATLKLATSLANLGRNAEACAAAAEFDKRYAETSSTRARGRSASVKTRAKCDA